MQVLGMIDELRGRIRALDDEIWTGCERVEEHSHSHALDPLMATVAPRKAELSWNE